MTKLTLTEQEELFAKDCKLINLRYEYTNYTGKEKWAVVTELTEKELRKKYPDIIKRYTPFVLLSMAQGEVINEADRNDDKYEKRAKRTLDVYGYEDDISEQFHRELITPFADPFEQAEEERLEIEREQLRRTEIANQEKLTSKTNEIPIWERQWLTIEEASEYSGIARRKLRELSNTSGCPFAIWMGNKIHIIREKLDRYTETHNRI